MNKNNRITYRFDRAGQTIDDNSRKENNAKPQTVPVRDPGKPSNIVPLYSSTEYEQAASPFSPWMSPFQEDVSALEDLIRETEEKPKAVPAPAPTSERKQSEIPQPPIPQPEEAQQSAEWHPRKRVHAEVMQGNAVKPQPEAISKAPVQPEKPIAAQQRAVDASSEEQHFPEVELETDSAKRWSGPVHKYSAPPSWIKVFLSVAGALATGALFGYLLLNLFTNMPDQTKGTNDNPANPVNGTVSNNPTASPANGKTNTNKGTNVAPTAGQVKLDIPAQTYQLLQYGVFSNAEGSDAAIKELTDKGLAAAGLKTADDYRVYAGMAIDRGKAMTLSNDLGEDVPVYIKQVDVEVPQQFPFAGDAKAATAFMNNTISLISMLDELSLTQLEQTDLSPLSSAAADAWQAEHQQWTASVKAMQAGVTDEAGKAFLIKLIQSMNTAAKSLQEYDKKPSQSHLWAVQDAVMEAVVTQKEWYDAIRAL
ncbi:hypothetical protein [Paenibacillus glycanilyticus]|uniref:SPOR domain-containing protein n=1 Tax=Paenibacillus glycanilyticus TaxID=126569 RepID=A0ABQ6GFB0_9BACL|nr:hypothetical protein [Paenibacillus glycanilyticus]GLX69538.1 hypothetical protein MU1_38830 [Paenibacillus glycanilyticus]